MTIVYVFGEKEKTIRSTVKKKKIAVMRTLKLGF